MSGPGWIDGVRGVLLDVDGTLLAGPEAIPGAGDAIERLRSARVPFRLTTNTTRRPRTAIARALAAAGIRVDPGEILVPASLAASRIRASGKRRTHLLVPAECLEDLEGIEPSEEEAAWVVVGDLGPGFTFDRLNRAFHALRAGARLLALHRGRFWRSDAGEIVLDAGPFVAALEYAAGVEAELVGKPARPFFDLAVADLGLERSSVLVVGDDLENDVAGGARAGLRTARVRTGVPDAARPGVVDRPDLDLDSIADLAPPR